ncbi:MAG TPA: DUF3084 domain-containing protein [Armatimonadota bacterium]|nr:DUF3084 domain-containing protein [Armatimonadota bacterium]
MTWPNVIALAVFVCVCGFIAYWGDILGRRMGKRRLTIFGLRPRYTAILTTTITGMLIALLTITVMATVSGEVKEIVLRGHQILREYQAAQAAYSAVTKELRKQREIAEKARKEAEEAVRQRDSLAEEIARLSKSLKKLDSDLQRNGATLRRTEKQLASSKHDIEKRSLEIAKLEKQRADLKHDVVVLLKDMGEAATKWQQYIGLRERNIIFRSNEEIARRVIRCAQSKLEIRGEVLALLDDADQRARAEGAKPGDNDKAIKIRPKWWPGTGESGTGRFLKDSESIDALVDQIAGGSGSIVARVVSVGNSVEGEQAMIEFVPNYNRLVYSAGQEVAQTVIDGGASQGQILGQVITFLRAEVRPAAIGMGVIPHSDEEQQATVGQLSPDQLLAIVDRVKAAGRRVRLTALAKVDTWSAGPLDLDFRIEATE